jgi:hypothetical protein
MPQGRFVQSQKFRATVYPQQIHNLKGEDRRGLVTTCCARIHSSESPRRPANGFQSEGRRHGDIGPTMLARIGVMQALNRHHVREFNPDRKDHHWGKRKLKRDQ